MRIAVMVLFGILTALGAADDSPRSQYEAIVREFNTAVESHVKATNKDRMNASLVRPQPNEFAVRFFALAETYPEDPSALDALAWITSKCVFGAHAEKSLGMIARDHSRSERLKNFCGECSRYGEPFQPYEEMLRAVLKDTPHRDVKGAASLALADYLKMAKESTESNLVKIAIQGEESLGKELLVKVQKMKQLGLDAVAAESASLFQKVIDEFGDMWFESNYPQNAAELAKEELYLLRNLCIGQQAPEIIGKDIYGKPMKLTDFRGKVVVLDFGSHRSCGMCRQTYPQFRSIVDAFREKPFALLGISVDDDVKELVSLAEKGENTWPIWWDGENFEGPLASQWVIRSMPTMFVLDHKGVIRNKGFIQKVDIVATVEMLLREFTAAKP